MNLSRWPLIKIYGCVFAAFAIGFANLQECVASGNAQLSPCGNEESEAEQNRASFQVFNPDGSKAESAEAVIGDSAFTKMLFKNGTIIVEDARRLAIPILECEDGSITINRPDEIGDRAYCAIWNDSGYFQLPAKRMLDTAEIRLLPWRTVRVQLIAETKPVIESQNIALISALTSNGLFQGLGLQFSSVTDETGVAVFDKVPPGECNVSLNAPPRQGEDMVEQTYKQQHFFFVETDMDPVFEINLKSPGIISRIRTQVAEPHIDFTTLRCEIRDMETNSFYTATVDADGFIHCARLPFGKYTATVNSTYSVEAKARWYGTLEFEHSSENSKFGNSLFVGTTYIDTVENRSKKRELTAVEKPEAPKTVEDSFSNDQLVAFVGSCSRNGEQLLVFVSADGTVLREIISEPKYTAWITTSNRVSCDRVRGLWYVLNASDGERPALEVDVYDRYGQQIHSINVSPDTMRICVDHATGDLWLLTPSNLSELGTTYVLNHNGKLINSFTTEGFCIDYSHNQAGFWLAGQTVTFIDSKTLQQHSTNANYPGIFVFGGISAMPDGGAVASEYVGASSPESRYRLITFDAQANQIAEFDLGNLRPHKTAVVGNEIWAACSPVDRLWSRNKSRLQATVQRFSLDLKPIGIIQDATSFASFGDTILLSRDGFIQEVRPGDDGSLDVLSSKPYFSIGFH